MKKRHLICVPLGLILVAACSWYRVYDRRREAVETGDIRSIFDRNSLNFDFALYDPAHRRLWSFFRRIPDGFP